MIKLTQFSHGGGCGCKIAPAVLEKMLAGVPEGIVPAELLVGNEHADDAAVYRVNDHQAVVATTDFFTPIVDDPYDFGRIAATNALSDVYAMGGEPIMALAIVGMPMDKLPAEVIARILEGGASVCRDAAIPLAGGHSIDVLEPIYGLVGMGLVHPGQVKTNAGAREGDILLLTKPLGIGVLSAALKRGQLTPEAYASMLGWTTLLNRVGARLANYEAVHAMTDVTGFGLAGHALEICRASELSASLDMAAVPLIDAARALVCEGVVTGASARNWASYGQSVALDPGLADWQRALLTDPQTSGGLLIACDPAAVATIRQVVMATQNTEAHIIGQMEAGQPQLRVKG